MEVVNEEFCRTLFDDPAAVSSQLVAQTWSGGVGRFEDPGLLVETSSGNRRHTARSVHVW